MRRVNPFYSERVTREFFANFKSGGAPEEYIFVADHALRIGHLVATDPKLWDAKVDTFLKALP